MDAPEKTATLPKVVPVRQSFPHPRVGNLEATPREQCMREDLARRVRPGMSVAITAGSRGIADIAPIMRSLVGILKDLGAKPFIVPAMGSHARATAGGQAAMLVGFGITGERCDAPVRSSMEVVDLGVTESGVTAYMDRLTPAERYRGNRRAIGVRLRLRV